MLSNTRHTLVRHTLAAELPVPSESRMILRPMEAPFLVQPQVIAAVLGWQRIETSAKPQNAAASSFAPGNFTSRSICVSVAAISLATVLLTITTGFAAYPFG